MMLKIFQFLIFLIFSLQFLSMAIQLLSPISYDICEGDNALIEINTINARHGNQMLGPYSRFGFHHPGPSFFYFSIPLYIFLGPAGIRLTALTINYISIMIILWSFFSFGGWRFFWGATTLSLYLYYLGYTVLASSWNPFFTILPLGVFIFLCLDISVGKIKRLPLAVFFGSFIMQNHIGYIPTIVTLALLTIIFYLKRNYDEIKNQIRAMVISFVVFIIMWAFPIAEQIVTEKGNFTKLFEFFITTKNTGHTFKESLNIVIFCFSSIPQAIFKIVNINVNPFSLKSVGILGISWLIFWFIKYNKLLNRYQSTVIIFIIIFFFTSLYSIVNIRGDLHEYLFKWVSIFGWLVWFALGFITIIYLKKTFNTFYQKNNNFLRSFSKFLCPLLIPAILIITLKNIPPSSSFLNFSSFGKKEYKKDDWYNSIYIFMLNIDDRPVIYIDDPVWPRAAGIANYLHKKNIKFYISNDWLNMFGDQFKTKSNDKTGKLLIKNTPSEPIDGIELIAKRENSMDREGKQNNIYIYYLKPSDR